MSFFHILMLFLCTFVDKGIDGCKDMQKEGKLHGRVELHGHIRKSQDVRSVQWIKHGSSRYLLYEFVKTASTTSTNNNKNIHFSEQNMSLTLLNLMPHDETMYEVETTLKNGQIQRCKINLTVSRPPVALRISVSFSNFTLSLKCEVEGKFLFLRWLLNGLTLPTDQRISFSEGNVSMEVANMTSADCGMFTCEVSNTVGQSQTHLNINGENIAVCQTNIMNIYQLVLPTSFTLIGILILCIILICLIKYVDGTANNFAKGLDQLDWFFWFTSSDPLQINTADGCNRKNTSDRENGETVPVVLQEGANASVVYALPCVYTDILSLRNVQKLAATSN